jgi:hypothetical protein
MTLKQLLKPDWRKIVIFAILCIIFSLINTGISGELIIPIIGLPLPFYYCMLGGVVILPNKPEAICSFNYSYLIIDIIIWYLFSCLMVWIYDKYFKKVKKK